MVDDQGQIGSIWGRELSLCNISRAFEHTDRLGLITVALLYEKHYNSISQAGGIGTGHGDAGHA